MYEVLVNCLLKLAQKKVWLGEMTIAIAVDLGHKATNKQTNKNQLQCPKSADLDHNSIFKSGYILV